MRAELDDQFREFVRDQTIPLRRFAYLLCADWHLAEDLVQAAFIKIYRAWPRIQRRETVGHCVRQTLVRCWLDERRRPWRRSEYQGSEPPEVADRSACPDARSEAEANRELVLRAMTEIAPRQRAVLVLRYWEELSVAETAAVLRCSEGNVKSQTARGLDKLRTVLARIESTPAATRRAS